MMQKVLNGVFRIKYLYPLRMQKEVVIYNGRLTCMLITLQAGLVALLAFMFIKSKQYLVESQAQMTPMAWRNSMPPEVFAAGVQADENSDACHPTRKHRFDFQYDSTFVYADHECITLPEAEKFVKIGNSIVYFPSYFMEEQMVYNHNKEECKVLFNSTGFPLSSYDDNGCATASYKWGSSCMQYEYTNGMVVSSQGEWEAMKAAELAAAATSSSSSTTAVPSATASRRQLSDDKSTRSFSSSTASTVVSREPPMATSEQRDLRTASNENLLNCFYYKRQNFLVKGVGKQKLEFSHVYEDVNPSTYTVEKGKSAWKKAQVEEQIKDGLRVRQVFSVVESFRNGQYEEFDCELPKKGQCRFVPGEALSLSLEQWASAAGDGIDLADATFINADAIGMNKFENSEFAHPLLRTTGMEITLQVSYFDPIYLEEDYNFNGVIAKVQVKGNIDWASRQVTDYGTLPYAMKGANSGKAETRFRYYYGIRFVFREGSSGKFGYLVLPALAALVAVVAVYMGFVTQFMKVFVTRLLGDTSRNYRRVQLDSFNLDRDGQQSFPAKAIMAAAAFQYLVDKQQAGGFVKRLSYKTADIPSQFGDLYSNPKSQNHGQMEGQYYSHGVAHGQYLDNLSLANNVSRRNSVNSDAGNNASRRNSEVAKVAPEMVDEAVAVLSDSEPMKPAKRSLAHRMVGAAGMPAPGVTNSENVSTATEGQTEGSHYAGNYGLGSQNIGTSASTSAFRSMRNYALGNPNVEGNHRAANYYAEGSHRAENGSQNDSKDNFDITNGNDVGLASEFDIGRDFDCGEGNADYVEGSHRAGNYQLCNFQPGANNHNTTNPANASSNDFAWYDQSLKPNFNSAPPNTIQSPNAIPSGSPSDASQGGKSMGSQGGSQNFMVNNSNPFAQPAIGSILGTSGNTGPSILNGTSGSGLSLGEIQAKNTGNLGSSAGLSSLERGTEASHFADNASNSGYAQHGPIKCNILGQPKNTADRVPLSAYGSKTLEPDFLYEVLKVSFGNSLDEDSLKHMAFNVFASIAREEEFGAEVAVGSGPNAEKRQRRSKELETSPVMHLESFVRAVLRADPVDLPALTNMYDMLDSTNCVEKLFSESLKTTIPGEYRGKRKGPGNEHDLSQFNIFD